MIELLGKLGDVSPGALALYRAGLVSEENDVFKKTAEAILALSALPAIRSLLPDVEAVEHSKREPVVIGLLGHLGSEQFERRARAAIAADDLGFGALVQALRRLPAVAAPLGPELLARLRMTAPETPASFNAIEVLCAIDIEDRSYMEPIVRSFVSRGGGWTKRAEALLARWS